MVNESASTVFAAHVSLIDLGWIYEETQRGLQGLTVPIYYVQQTGPHTLWHYVRLSYQNTTLIY